MTARMTATTNIDARDYIIAGGCMPANRLSTDPKTSVLLLEAGGKDNYHWRRMGNVGRSWDDAPPGFRKTENRHAGGDDRAVVDDRTTKVPCHA